MTAAVDGRRFAVVLAALVGVAALVALGWPAPAPPTAADSGEPPQARDRKPAPSERPHQPDQAPPASPQPATVTAVEPVDADLLAQAERVAADWIRAFATTRPDHAAWLEALRPVTTPQLHAALAASDRADLLGDHPRAAQPLGTEIRTATAARIAVRVRLTFDDAADEHALDVVVVPTAAGPLVDEVRL